MIRNGKFKMTDEVWKGISQSAKDFVTACLTLNVSKRPSAQQLLDNGWLAKMVENVDGNTASEALSNLK
jgi:calcium/calmodulin-dependent protein kinase I